MRSTSITCNKHGGTFGLQAKPDGKPTSSATTTCAQNGKIAVIPAARPPQCRRRKRARRHRGEYPLGSPDAAMKMTLKLLVDTSVWLDLAKDYRQQPVISALEDLVESGEIELLVPQVVLDEFAHNKERVAADAKRSLQSHFNLVRDAVNRFGEESDKASTRPRSARR
jgi:hypothetical protein